MKEFTFDFTSYRATVNSLSQFTGVDAVDIELFVHRNAYDYDSLLEKLIHHYNINLDSLDIRNLYLKTIQVTTNGDNCKSINKYGLLNTQEAIKKDTYLARYLKSKEIEIDFEKESINYKGRVYYRSKENSRKVDLCCTKLFSIMHYPINAFIYSDNVLNYPGMVRERPELIGNLAEAFDKSIERDWIKNTQCFLIVIKVNINDLDYTTFTDNKVEFEDDKEIVVKEWLIERSIDLIHDLKLRGWHSDIYAYMNSKHKVELENIIDTIKIND
ncbi:TPA: hypothetical protein LA742_003246 [Clostridium botulinum]|nr:hypothetical protein [Clostridium botulinum]